MADRTYRRGERDRSDRERSYNRQAEQFDADQGWREDERGYGQMGDSWRDDDYGDYDAGRSYGRDREAARDWGRDPGYRRRSEPAPGYASARHRHSGYGPGRTGGFGMFTGSDFGGQDFTNSRYTGGRPMAGAGSQLAANHGEWREGYGATPSREYRDYRGNWGDDDSRNWFDRATDTVAGWFSDDDDEHPRERGYRGHGPSGYTRSDERIMEDACDALTDDWRVDARQVSVTVKDGEITLDGTVPSRDHKRRAEDCVDELSGVRHVQNNLRVQERTEWDRGESREFGKRSDAPGSEA